MTLWTIQSLMVAVFGLMLVAAMIMRRKQPTTNTAFKTEQIQQPVDPSSMLSIWPRTVSEPPVGKEVPTRKEMRRAITNACQTLSIPTKPRHVRERAKNFLMNLDDRWSGLFIQAWGRVFKGGREWSLEN